MVEEESVTLWRGHLAVSSRSGTRTCGGDVGGWRGVRVPCRPGARVWQEHMEQTFKKVPLSVPCLPGPALVLCAWKQNEIICKQEHVNDCYSFNHHSSFVFPTHVIKKKGFPPLCFHFREKRDDPKNEGLSRVWKEKQVRNNTRLPRGHVFSGDQKQQHCLF